MLYNELIKHDFALINFSWNEGLIGLKDFNLKTIQRNYKTLMPLVEPLVDILPVKKKYILVDFFEQELKPNTGTCVHTGWHLDGKMNVDDPEYYVIWAKGDYRTLFANAFESDIEIDLSDKQKSFDSILNSSNVSHFEVCDSVPILYNTFSFHKGRDVHSNGKRTFCRVMTSNLIEPKNKVI